MQIVDSHAHVFRRGLPTTEHARYVPDYDAAIEAYLALLDQHYIAGAVLVQPSFPGSDNRFLLACLRQHPERLRAAVVLDDDLRALANDGVAGVRVNLIGRPAPDLRGPSWRALAAELGRRGQHLEIQANGEQWAALAPTLRKWPSAVVIDHLGLPGVSAEVDRAVLTLARHEHVWVKA